ncbi:hypothetical protein [Nonomuraea recticatena]
MRGLFFDHPGDEAIWSYPLQYKLGDALLVIPVTEPDADKVEAYLPEGEWVDVWTGLALDGGQVLTLPAPIDRPPVLCTAQHWQELSAVFAP